LKLPGGRTSLYAVGFVIFLLAFAYLELTYTRRVESTSMLPTLEEGDLVVVQPVPFSDLKVGDIIVYDPPCSVTGASVIHRIIAFTSGAALTKGDNNPYTDPQGRISDGPITPDCYVGKVVYVFPYVERIASLPYGANYILAALIFVALIYLQLRGKNGAEEEEEEQEPSGDGKLLPGLGPERS
jgi:signal peptidase